MFGKKKKESPSSAQAGITVPPETLDRIRTMPDRFYLAPRTRANRTFIVFGVLIIVVGLLVAVALWMWKFGPSAGGPAATPTPEASAPPVTVPTPSGAPSPSPAPSPTPEIVPTPTPEPSPSPAASPSAEGASDQDADGLTFNEERLYGTDPAQGDSDGDGFLDGAEVANGYSPRDAAGKTLVADGTFQFSSIGLSGYRWAYPTSWLSQETNEGGVVSIQLDSQQGEYVAAVISPNPQKLTLRDFLKQQGNLTGGAIPEVVDVKVNGVAGLMWPSPPQFHFPTADGKSVLTLIYLPIGQKNWGFTNTFEGIMTTFGKAP